VRFAGDTHSVAEFSKVVDDALGDPDVGVVRMAPGLETGVRMNQWYFKIIQNYLQKRFSVTINLFVS